MSSRHRVRPAALNWVLAASQAPCLSEQFGAVEGGGRLNTIQYLEDQAARAERLAKRITDTLTIERLQAFADERRREIEVIAGKYRRA
ncbi:hypothetical protein GA0061098_101251 [Bradyrhizobium shewense]|uniref:Uncharacterized protein n=1 Tax=Bradyrhizobium shewense TaxID=1761772 RepID=A0A1C3X497_9BRAD|nr:hypothetical protein GA0061098_101251 [Bradyrhizobium shewense]